MQITLNYDVRMRQFVGEFTQLISHSNERYYASHGPLF